VPAEIIPIEGRIRRRQVPGTTIHEHHRAAWSADRRPRSPVGSRRAGGPQGARRPAGHGRGEVMGFRTCSGRCAGVTRATWSQCSSVPLEPQVRDVGVGRTPARPADRYFKVSVW